MARSFKVNPPEDDMPSLLIGLMGPPGGGKTKSALRMGDGISRVRGGRPCLIDTEAGRSLKHRLGSRNPHGHEFDYIPFSPPFVPENFLDAIREAQKLNPSCIILDSMSDEHEGEGGYLEWHDREVDGAGGNKWAAWAKPSASRRKLIAGLQHIKIPVIMTFRAREKTKQVGKKIVPIGFVPVAPMEVVHTLDLTCLLPPRSNGVAVWSSREEAESLTLKFAGFLAHMIRQGAPLDERFGDELARWQAGEARSMAGEEVTQKRRNTPEQNVDAYIAAIADLPDRDAFLEYQLDERRAAWIAKLKTDRPDLHDRIVTANSKRLNALTPREPDDEEEQPRQSTPPASASDNNGDDDQFPETGE